EILTGENSILSKAFPASVARFFMLQAHYRSILDFSDDAIVAAEKGYKRLMEAVATLKQLKANTDSTIDTATWKQSSYDAMNDDFNSPILIAQLFEGVRFINLLHDGKETLNAVDLEIFSNAMNEFIFDVLGLEAEKTANNSNDKLEAVVNMLIEMRNQARADKNFKLSDQIRDQLIAYDIQLKDSKEGTTFTV
ncbi:MAG: cysteine--tRNA ligase, partial [Flavobacterium sp.]